ncbi:fibrobacter succinogenes major paralogous domain-containing protein [Sunxiuqinia sp. A32]|uniref:fibrobacter succinogenes major paralogous domain-containing protein n=1 Tax=Sunxiuqinia sp. A32 TaxID=3461496 RepID=UPI0040455D76
MSLLKRTKVFFLLMLMSVIISCSKDNAETIEDFTGDSGTFVDQRDGQTYKWVRIDSQIWMAENLKTILFDSGNQIPQVIESSEWVNSRTSSYCWYDNDETIGKTYGALYNWYAVESGKLAPIGWHVPSESEWEELIEFIGGNTIAGEELREEGNQHWIENSQNTNNVHGFSALPSGYRSYEEGSFNHLGANAIWWSSTAKTEQTARMYSISSSSSIFTTTEQKWWGYAVRCIKD